MSNEKEQSGKPATRQSGAAVVKRAEGSGIILEVADVSKSYLHNKQTVKALENINLSISKNDIYGIIGLSGAGKSTLMRCMTGFLKPSSGKIIFHQNDINLFKTNELRQFRMKIGMIFQHFNLLSSRTVAENIAFPLEVAHLSPNERNKRVDELLLLVGLSSKKNAYPASLSGGEKQRVGIARALANFPEILFCDEATSALDPKTTNEVLELLKKINQELGLTIVLITHAMEVIKKICNKVAVIEGGKIVEQGPVTTLFAEPKHPTTKYFIQSTSHELPSYFYSGSSSGKKLVRLRFKGETAKEPLISQIVKMHAVDANIVLGWIDHFQATTVGTLIIELTGNPEKIAASLNYLTERSVSYDLLEDDAP